MNWSWYTFCVVLAFGVGSFYFVFSLWRKRVPELMNLFILSLFFVPFALLGARLWNYLNLERLQQHIDQGTWENRFINFFGLTEKGLEGLSLFGGLFATFLYFIPVFFWYSSRNHISFWFGFDILVQSILIFQIIGRWGNFFNQELLGSVVTENYPQELSWLPEWFASKLHFSGHDSVDIVRQPLFLYESFANFLLLLLLLFLKRLGIYMLFFQSKKNTVLHHKILILQKKPLFFGIYFWKKWKIVNQFWKENVFHPPVNFQTTPLVSVGSGSLGRWKVLPFASCVSYQKQKSLINQENSYWQRSTGKFLLFFQRDSTRLVNHFNPAQLVIPRLGLVSFSYLFGYGLIRIILQTFREGIELSEPGPTPYYACAVLLTIGFFGFLFIQFVVPYKWRSVNWYYETWYWKR